MTEPHGDVAWLDRAAALIASHRLERRPLSSLEPKLRPPDIESGYRLPASTTPWMPVR
jgi:hypothetical protein